IARSDVGAVLQRMMFPSLTSIGNDQAELRRGYLKLLRGIALCVVPISVGLAALAPGVVGVLLGWRWVIVAPVLAILALFGSLHVFMGNAGTLLRATQNQHHATISEAISLAVAAALIFPLAARFQLAGVALAMAVGAAAG